MSIAVPLYGFGGSGGGTGGTLTVTAPAGVTVTVSKDGKTKTKIANAEGVAIFKGLATGDWTVTITDGTQTATKTVTVTADYSTDITFFSATINVTYPAGSTCTATDGVTTLTAPDTGGSWVCVVPNTGTWTVTVTDGTQTARANVSITEDGQTASTTLSYKLIFVDAENGVYNSGETSAWDTSHKLSGSTFSLTKNTNGEYVMSVKYSSGTAYGNASIAVDLTGWDTLHMKGTISNGGTHSGVSSAVAIYKNLDDDAPTAESTIGTGSKNIELNIDVSKLSGTYYLNLFIASPSGSTATITISELWLE